MRAISATSPLLPVTVSGFHPSDSAIEESFGRDNAILSAEFRNRAASLISFSVDEK